MYINTNVCVYPYMYMFTKMTVFECVHMYIYICIHVFAYVTCVYICTFKYVIIKNSFMKINICK